MEAPTLLSAAAPRAAASTETFSPPRPFRRRRDQARAWSARPLATLLVAALAAGALAGCAATPNQRAQERAAVFGRLSPQDRQLALSGRIREGFPRDAVYVAWGEPTRVYQGRDRGRASEAWVYLTNPAPDPALIFPSTEFGYFGAGYGPLGGYRAGDPFFYYPYYPYFYGSAFYGGLAARPSPERPVKQAVFENGVVVKYQVLQTDRS